MQMECLDRFLRRLLGGKASPFKVFQANTLAGVLKITPRLLQPVLRPIHRLPRDRSQNLRPFSLPAT